MVDKGDYLPVVWGVVTICCFAGMVLAVANNQSWAIFLAMAGIFSAIVWYRAHSEARWVDKLWKESEMTEGFSEPEDNDTYQLEEKLRPDERLLAPPPLAPMAEPDSKPPTSYGWVYVLRNGTHYKIGKTNRNPEQRIRELQTGSPTKIHTVRLIRCKNPSQLELDLHYAFRHSRIAGEWFTLTAADLRVLKRIADDEEN